MVPVMSRAWMADKAVAKPIQRQALGGAVREAAACRRIERCRVSGRAL
jgi:hypothetical protein